MSRRSSSHAHPRPVVVISRCIDFDSCRYNGQLIRASLREELEPFVELRPVCPEVEIGLGVPRDPVRLVSHPQAVRMVQPTTGRDLTGAMEEFSARFLSGLGDVDGFLLKSRSPSCGVRDAKVLHSDGEEAGHESGPGLFAARVLERFPAAAVEDEVRLTSDQRLREHFLTKLFTLARLREALAGQTRAALAGFHASHELLLSAHDEQRGRRLGRLLEGAPARPPDALADEYRSELVAALARPPHPGRIAAVLARSVDGPALARQMLLAPYPEPLTRGDARFQGLSGAVR